MRRILMGLIRLYQLTLSKMLFALLGPVCRFEPSCSAYAFECVRIHGAWRGSLLSVKRLSKCHPFHPGGFDPPPPLPGADSSRAKATPSGTTADTREPAPSNVDAG